MCSLYRREGYRTLSHRRLGHRGRAGDAVRGVSNTTSPESKEVQANVRFTPEADILARVAIEVVKFR